MNKINDSKVEGGFSAASDEMPFNPPDAAMVRRFEERLSGNGRGNDRENGRESQGSDGNTKAPMATAHFAGTNVLRTDATASKATTAAQPQAQSEAAFAGDANVLSAGAGRAVPPDGTVLPQAEVNTSTITATVQSRAQGRTTLAGNANVLSAGAGRTVPPDGTVLLKAGGNTSAETTVAQPRAQSEAALAGDANVLSAGREKAFAGAERTVPPDRTVLLKAGGNTSAGTTIAQPRAQSEAAFAGDANVLSVGREKAFAGAERTVPPDGTVLPQAEVNTSTITATVQSRAQGRTTLAGNANVLSAGAERTVPPDGTILPNGAVLPQTEVNTSTVTATVQSRAQGRTTLAGNTNVLSAGSERTVPPDGTILPNGAVLPQTEINTSAVTISAQSRTQSGATLPSNANVPFAGSGRTIPPDGAILPNGAALPRTEVTPPVERNIPQSKMVVPEDRNVLQQNLDKVILDKSGPQDTGQKMEQNTRFEHSRESNFSHFSRNEQRGSGAVPQNLDRGTGQGAEFRHSGGSGAPFSEMVRPNAQQPGIVEPRDYTVTPQQHYVPEAGTAAQNFNRGAEQGTRFERHNEPNIPHSEVTRTVGEFAGERNRAAVNDVTSAIGRAHSRRAREDEERAVNNKLYRKVPENAGVPFSGDAILDRLRVSSEFHRTENINTEKQAGVIKSISQEVAERILASTAALNARQEVRVMIKDNILRNTEVIIAKDGKMVSVDFFTSALESASLLSSKQSDLRSHLLNTLQDVNDVDVNIYQETDEANPDDSKDGRSRDEYVGDEDDSNEGKGARRNFRN